MPPKSEEERIHPGTRAEWRRWLQHNHQRTTGIWLVFWKKASGKALMDYDTAVEEALCFGWIDSKPRMLDEQRSMLWMAPRKSRSGWSRPNKQRVERAIASGRMTAVGQAKIEAAKRDGSWSALDQIEDLVIPPDLTAALKAHAHAADHFEDFPRSVKRGILEWIANAKRSETRAARVEETATMAARNERANQWRKSRSAAAGVERR
ncbi:MAG: YdeI/OmpD-associated family protein [Burkholderiales bacterium]